MEEGKEWQILRGVRIDVEKTQARYVSTCFKFCFFFVFCLSLAMQSWIAFFVCSGLVGISWFAVHYHSTDSANTCWIEKRIGKIIKASYQNPYAADQREKLLIEQKVGDIAEELETLRSQTQTHEETSRKFERAQEHTASQKKEIESLKDQIRTLTDSIDRLKGERDKLKSSGEKYEGLQRANKELEKEAVVLRGQVQGFLEIDEFRLRGIGSADDPRLKQVALDEAKRNLEGARDTFDENLGRMDYVPADIKLLGWVDDRLGSGNLFSLKDGFEQLRQDIRTRLWIYQKPFTKAFDQWNDEEDESIPPPAWFGDALMEGASRGEMFEWVKQEAFRNFIGQDIYANVVPPPESWRAKA